jgi:hypothetical protein
VYCIGVGVRSAACPFEQARKGSNSGKKSVVLATLGSGVSMMGSAASPLPCFGSFEPWEVMVSVLLCILDGLDNTRFA